MVRPHQILDVQLVLWLGLGLALLLGLAAIFAICVAICFVLRTLSLATLLSILGLFTLTLGELLTLHVTSIKPKVIG